MLKKYWRGLVCASLLLAGLYSSTSAQDARFFRIGTAATAGSFFEIGGLIASAISSPPGTPPCGHGGSCGVPGLVAVAQTTQGSLDNLRLINNGQLESGFAQADLAGWAYKGANIFIDAGPMTRLRAIASLFPESLHVVVRADSPIQSMSGLAGKTVGLGEPGSGTLANARTMLAALGLGAEGALIRKYLRPGPAIEELKAGTIDAFFLVGVHPIAAIRELAGTTPIRLLSVDGKALESLQSEFGFYSRATIPGGSYPGVTEETVSVGFSALWVVGAGVDSDLVFAITKSLWNEATERMLGSLPLAQRIKRDRALVGLSVPLHPGAERFYRDAGMAVDMLPQPPDERVEKEGK